MRTHRCGQLDVRLRRRTRLDDERLAVEHTHRAIVLAPDIERRVERHRTPEADLRCSLEEAGNNARAVSAVTAL
jgi:hypothetical protein